MTEAALVVGYDSASAFVATFKRTFGATPRRYFSIGTRQRQAIE